MPAVLVALALCQAEKPPEPELALFAMAGLAAPASVRRRETGDLLAFQLGGGDFHPRGPGAYAVDVWVDTDTGLREFLGLIRVTLARGIGFELEDGPDALRVGIAAGGTVGLAFEEFRYAGQSTGSIGHCGGVAVSIFIGRGDPPTREEPKPPPASAFLLSAEFLSLGTDNLRTVLLLSAGLTLGF